MSVCPFTPFAVAREPFASQLCLLTALTHERFASSLCLCLCLCQQGLAGTRQSPRRDSQALCLTSSGLLLLMICFFDWDPGDSEHSAQTTSMPTRELWYTQFKVFYRFFWSTDSQAPMRCSPELHPDEAEHRVHGARDGHTERLGSRRDTRAHSSTFSSVSSGQWPPMPCVLRQSDILNTLNIVHVQLETAEHVNLVAVT